MKRLLRTSIAFISLAVLLTGQLLLAPPLVMAGAPAPAHVTDYLYSSVQTWGGSGKDGAGNILIDSAGNLYIAGSFTGEVDFDPDDDGLASRTAANNSIDAFLSKFDAGGNFLWVQTWGAGETDGVSAAGRTVASGMGIDAAGSNIYITGPYQFTVKFDPDPEVDPDPGTNTFTSNAFSMTGVAHGGNNIYLLKLSTDGVFQWVKTWGPVEQGGEAYSLALDSADNIYLAGDFSGSTAVDFDPDPDPERTEYHTNHPPITYPTVPPTPGALMWDGFLSKFRPDGTFEWAKTWGGESYDDGPGVDVDSNGNIYVTGMYSSHDINFDPAGGPAGEGHGLSLDDSLHFRVDVFLIKFDPSGDFVWVNTWGGPGAEDAGGNVMVDDEDNIYAAGRFSCQGCDFDPGLAVDTRSARGDMDGYLSKFNPAGGLVWASTWGGAYYDATANFSMDGAGNIYAAGICNEQFTVKVIAGVPIKTPIASDSCVTKISPTGGVRWTKAWGGGVDNMASRVAFTPPAGDIMYVVGGFSGTVDFNTGDSVDEHTAADLSDAYLAKYVFIALPWDIYLPVARR